MARIAAFANRHRRGLIVTGVALAAIGAVLIGLPYAARLALAHWLRADGAQEASIERIVIDYLEPGIEIRGLAVTEKTGRTLRLGRAALALDLPALWHRRLHLRALSLDGGEIELVQADDGRLRLAGIPEAPASVENPTPSRPWLIGIDETAVNGLRIRLQTPEGAQDFTVESARLGTIAMWAGEAPTALQLAVAVGNGSLRIGGEATPLGNARAITLDLDVKALDLSRAALLPGIGDIGGIFAGRFQLSAKFPHDKGPEIDLAGSASLDGLKLNDQPSALALSALAWTGEAKLGTNTSGALTARLTGKLTLGKLAAGAATLASATFSGLDAKATYDAGAGIVADVTGGIEMTGARMELGGAKASADRLRWNGSLHARSSPGAGVDLTAKGDLTAEAPRYAAPGASPGERTEAGFARIAYKGLDAHVASPVTGPMRISLAGALDAGEIDARAGADRFTDGELGWNGTVSVTSTPGGEAEVALEGTLDGKALALDLASFGYRTAQQELHWQGTAKLGPDGAPTMAASMRATELSVDVKEPEMRLLDVGALSLDEATLGPDGRLAAKQLQAERLRAFRPQGTTDAAESLAAFGSLTADGVTLEGGKRISTGRIRIADAELQVERDKEGRLRRAGILAALRGDKSPDASGAKPPELVVGDLALGGKSQIQFTDRSVDPPAKILLGPLRLHLGALDSAAPDRAVPIEIESELGRYSALSLKGTAKPFSKRVNVDTTGKLNGFDLASLSGYLSQYLGYNLSRGRLDGEVRVRIVDGVLDSTSNLNITNLVVTQGHSEAAQALQRNLEISLDTALSLLRDSDDVIHLNVPVTGDIASPNFDLSDAINTAIGNAMKRTVTTLLTVAFPVGGLIVAIVESSGDKALTFKPIAFAGGEVDLDANATEYLDTLARLLAARPGVKVTTCGIATERDAADIFRVRKERAEAATREKAARGEMLAKEEPVPVTRDDLYDLSHRRSEAVKDYLVGRKGADESRVFICAPNVSDDPQAAPHAEITL